METWTMKVLFTVHTLSIPSPWSRVREPLIIVLFPGLPGLASVSW